jgi:hypothetical protein
VDRPNRVVHWRQRVRARSCPAEDDGTSLNPQSSQPRGTLIQIDVTFTLSRRLVWLLAGIAIGNLRLPDGFLEKANLVLQGLLPG